MVETVEPASQDPGGTIPPDQLVLNEIGPRRGTRHGSCGHRIQFKRLGQGFLQSLPIQIPLLKHAVENVIARRYRSIRVRARSRRICGHGQTDEHVAAWAVLKAAGRSPKYRCAAALHPVTSFTKIERVEV